MTYYTEWVIERLKEAELLCTETVEWTCDVPNCHERPIKIYVFRGVDHPELWQFCEKHNVEIGKAIAKEMAK